MARPAAPALPVPPRARWTAGRLVAGSALVVLAIALFLPWYSATQGVPVSPDAGAAPVGAYDGPISHGFLWIVLALATAGIALIARGEAIGRLLGNLLAPRQLLVGTTGVAFSLCLLGVIARPAGYAIPVAYPGSPLGVADINTVFVGWSYGGFIAVVAAAVALGAAVWIAIPPHPAGSPSR
jgi:hypothetical protein